MDMRIKPKRKKIKMSKPGEDGTKIFRTSVRVTSSRNTTRSLRARPGTFEWAYARRTADLALYHAGSHYAQLWEAAGTADARSPDYEAVKGASWKGMPDRRCDAMSELKFAFEKLGEAPTQRLTLYCVRGHTASEIAKIYQVEDREMAHVLRQDLRDCARHFRFLSVPPVDQVK